MGPDLVFSISRLLGLFPYERDGRQSKKLIVFSLIMNSLYTLFILTGLTLYLRSIFVSRESSVSAVTLLGSLKLIIFQSALFMHGYSIFYDRHISFVIIMVRNHTTDYFRSGVGAYLDQLAVALASLLDLALVGLTYYLNPPNLRTTSLTIIYFIFPSLSIVNSLVSLQMLCFLRGVLLSVEFFQTGVVSVFMVREHHIVRRVCDQIDKLYGGFLLLLIVQNFVLVVQVTSHDVFLGDELRLLKTAARTVKIMWAVVFNMRVLNFTLQVIAIVVFCEKISKQMNQYVSRLFQVVRKDPHLTSSYYIFRSYLRARPFVHFTAAKFFRIEYPLLISILGAVVTYCTIIVQFSSGL